MQLKGVFEASFLASILQLLCNDKKTGVLHLFNDRDDVKIFIKEGTVIYAMGSQKESRLGYLLKSKGIITEQQLQKCLSATRDTNQSLGKILVKRGYISTEILKKIIQRQAKEIIFNLFLWDQGQFEYQDTELNLKGLLVTHIDIMTIVLEATRRIDEMSILKKQITSDKLILRISEKVQHREEMKFNAIEWRFLSLIDGKRTVRRLIEESGYDDFSVFKVLYSLLSFGIVEKAEEKAADCGNPSNCYRAVIEVFAEVLRKVRHNLNKRLAEQPFMMISEPTDGKGCAEGQVLSTRRQRELIQWSANIVRGCKPQNGSVQQHVFQNFDLGDDTEGEVASLLEALEPFETESEALQFLIDGLNQFTERLLDRYLLFAGPKLTLEILKELEHQLCDLGAGRPEDVTGKAQSLAHLGETLANTKAKINDCKTWPLRSAGIFALPSS